jgi:hypothetical protein
MEWMMEISNVVYGNDNVEYRLKQFEISCGVKLHTEIIEDGFIVKYKSIDSVALMKIIRALVFNGFNNIELCAGHIKVSTKETDYFKIHW